MGSELAGRAAVSKPVAAAQLLDELASFVRRYVVVTPAQADAIALWIAHTHAVDAAETTPYLSVTSAEMRSGKSRLLEVVELLVAKPLKAAGTSDAALFRSIQTKAPTVLMDEVDAIFGVKAMNHEDLRAMLNAGYRRGTPVLRCVGDGSKQRVEEFEVFCPKALAGIGELPDTLADRAVPIRLKRRARGEQLERFRRRAALAAAQPLRIAVAEWAATVVDELAAATPDLPDALDDRAQDAFEPLIAIADAVGGNWADRARQALVELRAGAAAADTESLGVRLLADIRTVFERYEVDRLTTSELLEALADDDEAPWGDWCGRGRLSANMLARLLKPYDVRSKTIRLAAGDTAKGYTRDAFEDAWRRYIGSLSEGSSRNNVTTRMVERKTGDFEPSHAEACDGCENGANPHGCGDVTLLRLETPETAADGSLEGAVIAEAEALVAAGEARWLP